MIWLTKIFIAIVVSFILSMLLAPMYIKWSRSLKLSQTILHYVEKHKDKQGTPTMGGVIFILPSVLTLLVFLNRNYSIAFYAALVTLAYGILGFLDDYIKVRYRQNKGLKAYQKIIGQLGIAIIASLYAYRNNIIGGNINIPFTSISVDIKAYSVILYIFIYIATTNSVNLTDGLDGLAAGASMTYLLSFLLCLVMLIFYYIYTGQTYLAMHMQSLGLFNGALIGALMGFLWHNANKATIFMGDTGALALGGAIASLAIFSNNPILIPIIGIMFVVSTLSVMIQVLYFKATHGKRVFSMAPYHHHLQDKGHSESKIAARYMIITFVMGIVALISIAMPYYI